MIQAELPAILNTIEIQKTIFISIDSYYMDLRAGISERK